MTRNDGEVLYETYRQVGDRLDVPPPWEDLPASVRLAFDTASRELDGWMALGEPAPSPPTEPHHPRDMLTGRWSDVARIAVIDAGHVPELYALLRLHWTEHKLRAVALRAQGLPWAAKLEAWSMVVLLDLYLQIRSSTDPCADDVRARFVAWAWRLARDLTSEDHLPTVAQIEAAARRLVIVAGWLHTHRPTITGLAFRLRIGRSVVRRILREQRLLPTKPTH